MKISDILHQIADAIDQQPQGVTEPATQPGLTPDHDGTFLPPLQAKLELLKKAVGVENSYDEMAAAEESDPEASNHKVTPMEPEEQDALERMKRAAGINAVVVSELADDEPLES
jgi:hypothetical protein